MPDRRRPARPRGPAPQGDKRQLYLQLVAQGVSNSAACRTVGVHRRTGTRWRYGRNMLDAAGHPYRHPPITAPGGSSKPISKRFLSVEERIIIADGLVRDQTLTAIAGELGRSVSTVSREIRRNLDPATGAYRPHAAEGRAAARRARPKPGKLTGNRELRDWVQARLAQRWSPEQISAALPAAFPGRVEMRMSHEAIYQALYLQGRGELSRELHRALRTGRACRRTRASAAGRRARFTAPMVMISERPAEADDRAVPGHWEGDLLMGASNRTAIGTLVERSTRYVMLLHLPAGRRAEQVHHALLDTIATLPAHLRRSLTWDQGREMGKHHDFTVASNIPVFFCDPASPWQRGSNENTNGLLRQYFPKGTDLGVHSPDELAAVAAQLNGRPRKTLDWQTPAQRLATLLAPSP